MKIKGKVTTVQFIWWKNVYITDKRIEYYADELKNRYGLKHEKKGSSLRKVRNIENKVNEQIK